MDHALDELCAQLTRDLFAIAKLLFYYMFYDDVMHCEAVSRSVGDALEIFNCIA